jgi:hypothetical protein
MPRRGQLLRNRTRMLVLGTGCLLVGLLFLGLAPDIQREDGWVSALGFGGGIGGVAVLAGVRHLVMGTKLETDRLKLRYRTKTVVIERASVHDASTRLIKGHAAPVITRTDGRCFEMPALEGLSIFPELRHRYTSKQWDKAIETVNEWRTR